MKKWLMPWFSTILVFSLMSGCSDADEEEGPVEDPEMQEEKSGNEENINQDDGTIGQDDDTMNKDGSEEGDQDEDGNMDEDDIDDTEKQHNDETEDQQ